MQNEAGPHARSDEIAPRGDERALPRRSWQGPFR
jgi:hypothetical protein